MYLNYLGIPKKIIQKTKTLKKIPEEIAYSHYTGPAEPIVPL